MPDQTANRPRPEDFLELVQKGKRGRLKLYVENIAPEVAWSARASP